MDTYTQQTRAWLDQRFDETSPDGVYLAHQPIYGFEAGHCEPALLPRYVRTLEIMRALARLRFESCLDVGAAEGYKAELVRRLFGAWVVPSDLSTSACRRAEEIFGLPARPGDLHEFPFEAGEFDVARCALRRSGTYPTFARRPQSCCASRGTLRLAGELVVSAARRPRTAAARVRIRRGRRFKVGNLTRGQ